MLLKLLQKIQEEIMLLNLLYDATIILIPKLDKDIKRKLQINTLVITGEKILNRILQTNLKIYFKKNL